MQASLLSRGLRRLQSLPRVTIVYSGLLALTVTLVWLGVLVHLRQEHDQYEREALQRADETARGFGESVASTFDAINNFEFMLRALYRADPAHFDLSHIPRNDRIDQQFAMQIGMTNRLGVVTSTNIAGGTNVSLADREHIAVHLKNPDDFLYISKPVIGRLSNLPLIQFSRKLYNQQNEFDGIIVISINPTYLGTYSNNTTLPGSTLSLVGLDDGVIRIRAPQRAGAIGLAVPSNQIQRIRNGADAAQYLNRSPIDGTMGFFAYHKLAHYNMAATASLSADLVFAAYERDERSYIVFTIIASMVILLIGAILISQTRRFADAELALAVTLANVGQGVLMHDPGDIIRVINQRAIDLLELPPHLAKVGNRNRDIVEWQLANNEFAKSDANGANISEERRRGGIGPEQYERERQNGVIIDIRTRQLDDGSVVRTFSDVTHRKRNEMALAAARDAAEAARRTQSDFLAVMSHEIRTPMNGVIGMAGLLLDSDLSPTQRRFAGTLREAAGSLMQIINDVLDFSKLEASQMEFESIPFALDTMINSVVDLLQVRAQEKQLWLRTQIAPQMPQFLIGDPGRLRQVLLNLVGNALKFTSEGGITIEVDGHPNGDGTVLLQLTVRDTGIGIPQVAQARLFEQFFQVDASTSRNFGGTGLGLAICRRLAERMGGRMSVESAPGVGSAFRLDVPLGIDTESHVDEHAKADEFPTSASPMRRLRILLAEDNVTNRLVAVTRLEMFGHRVDHVSNGVEALQMVQTVPYDLLLVDVMMPEMDGLEATRRIRAMSGPVRNVPIVAMTANVFSHHREACRAAGMDDFLGKPFTPAQLARVIDRAIAGKLRPLGDNGQVRPEDDQAAFLVLARQLGATDASALLEAFAVETRERLGRMRICAVANEFAELAHDAQAVQDATGSLGMNGLAGVAGRIHAAPQGDGVIAQINVMIATLEQIVGALRPAVAELAA